MSKYSQLQLYDYINKKYRVKDYETGKWVYVKRKYGLWIFKGIVFSKANNLNKWLKRSGEKSPLLYDSSIN